MFYIQLRAFGRLETVDEYETFREAAAMVKEYRFADQAGVYYVSRRPCKAWRNV